MLVCVFFVTLSCLEPRVTVGVGMDVLHARGSPYLEVRRASSEDSIYAALFDGGPHLGYDKRLFGVDRLAFHAGIAVAQPDTLVGTPLRYELRLGYNPAPRFSVQLVHESNCASVCDHPGLRWIPHGKSHSQNGGSNALTFSYRW
jgi:hypothetical protein